MMRVILIVLDSVGIGELPDAACYGDQGSNTLHSLWQTGALYVPNLTRLGLFNITGNEYVKPHDRPTASFARLVEASVGKDTIIGHWEIAGHVTQHLMPTYPNGFPADIQAEFKKATQRDILCNQPYSGTDVLNDFGEEHMRTGALIVYTSADSVFQIAANESVVPIDMLYRYCQIARDLMQGEHGVGRVIARPFVGKNKSEFKRTANRHDYAFEPQGETICDILHSHRINTVGVGKISDIFAGRGIGKSFKATDNADGMRQTIQLVQSGEPGLIFVNLVDFDSKYGHRNDALGYARALNEFDIQLGQLLSDLEPDDVLLITADHGCDPAAPGTDHTREYTPMLIYGNLIKAGVNLGIRGSFGDIAATVADLFAVRRPADGTSFFSSVMDHSTQE